MTKLRHPLTFENALTKVAATIGWTDVARIVGAAESTVRAWSDPDTSARMSLESACRLDIAFQAAGGEGAPFLACYATRLKADIGEIYGDRSKLLAGVVVAAKESGEAVAATIAAADPKATHADFVIAERELEEAITAGRNLIVTVRAMLRKLMNGRHPDEGNEAPEVSALRDLGALPCAERSTDEGTGEPPENPARAMEVAPPPNVTA